jgi:hypothetical protein
MNVPMKAQQRMTYAGRDLRAGEEFAAESESHARILEAGRKAKRRDPEPSQYRTRMMTAETLPRRSLEAMDAVELRALAARKGIKVHHRAGAEKLRQVIRAATA